MSRRLARIAALAVGLIGIEARALEATLSVDPATSLTIGLDAIGTASGPVVVSGNVEVTIHVTNHPTFGTVATVVTPTGGRLFVGNLGFSPSFGSHVSLSFATASLQAVPDGPAVVATPIGPGTARAPLNGIGVVLDSGTASAAGTALGSPVNVFLDFASASGALHEDSGALATIQTSGPVGGPVHVTITIPIDALLLALGGPPLDVPMKLQGQIVLSGNATAPIPSLPDGALGVLAALLVASAALAMRLGASAATAKDRSRTTRG